MKLNINFNAVIKAWLDAAPEDRDLEQGARILLQLTRNTIRYNSMIRNPAAHADVIEQELRAHLQRRESTPTPEEAVRIRAEAKAAIKEIFTLKENNPAKEFKAGKRPDHDSLPDDIKQLYVDNLEIRHRMQQYHLEIRTLIRSKKDCAPADLRDLVKLLKNADVQYHDNWEKYDHYGRQPKK